MKTKSKKTTNKKKNKTKPNHRKETNGSSSLADNNASWVDRLTFYKVVDNDDTATSVKEEDGTTTTTSLSLISWNVLAEAYCSRFSQRNLPVQYQHQVFDKTKRRHRIVQILRQLIQTNDIDVVCLQEVDLVEINVTLQAAGGYQGVETPRVVGGGAGGRTDACAVFVKKDTWKILDYEIVRLDDLATLSETNHDKTGSSVDHCSAISSNVQGMQQSFLRRNMALLVRIQHVSTGKTLVLSNAHLYWNPGFEYVKLCQAHYILLRAKEFCKNTDEPVVFCGDLNSRPHGVTHSYLSHGYINAKVLAPWYSSALYDNEETIVSDDDDDEDNTNKIDSENGYGDDEAGSDDEAQLINGLDQFLTLDSDHSVKATVADGEKPRMRYLLDASLNKFCRWLRILGQDTALETDEEEKLRTGKGELVIFDRCRAERRTLVTTSPKLMQRRDCPASAYCIHPPYLSKLEVALVHMLLTHGVVLEPSTFLSRCVVCNGNIVEVDSDAEKRRILEEYEAPPGLIDNGMEVYECDGCQQGYWWNDRPTSSASRVKVAATRLFELCLRAGVPIRGANQENLFEHVDVEGLRQQGWDSDLPGSDLLQQQLDVIDWLKNEHLECPFPLESAYASKKPKVNGDDSSESVVAGETLPFTNVTCDFVSVLDYIFFDKRYLQTSERLYVPTSFEELGDGRTYIENAHFLPSDVWPSDHLAIGARLSFITKEEEAEEDLNIQASSASIKESSGAAREQQLNDPTVVVVGADEPAPSINAAQFCVPVNGSAAATTVVAPSPHHGIQCACGCVPAIPSLFEMAELRKQAAKLNAAAAAAAKKH